MHSGSCRQMTSCKCVIACMYVYVYGNSPFTFYNVVGHRLN